MNIVKKIIDDSKMTRYEISKKSGISINTLDNWYLEKRKVNTSLVELIIAISDNDEEILKNIKQFSDFASNKIE